MSDSILTFEKIEKSFFGVPVLKVPPQLIVVAPQ